MSKFEKAFLIIKRLSARQTKIAEISNFDVIAKELDVPVGRLGLYLDHLQEIGLIRYSAAEQYIYLTEKGRKTESVEVKPAKQGIK